MTLFRNDPDSWEIGNERLGRPAVDEPDRRGDQQRREREQPAALGPLECPEPAGRLIVGPLRVAVLGEALPNKSRLAEVMA